MKFLFRWLRRKLKDANTQGGYSTAECPVTDKPASRNLDSTGTTFRLYKADGGTVVETTYVDKKHDYHYNLYIITSDQNLGERLEHILTYETLQR
jgi:hypothetical protein